MAQNRSTAVMARRKKGTALALDDFPTPPWATRAFLETCRAHFATHHTVWEPSANRGAMVLPLREHFGHDQVLASDVHDYGAGFHIIDFLWPDAGSPGPDPDWVITNPPFRLASQFLARGRQVARRGVALFLRLQWLESERRFEDVFSATPPTVVAIHVERVNLREGRLDPKVSNATAYAWFLWDKTFPGGTRLRWIPPCRQRLERDDDYPLAPAEAAPLFEGA